MAGERAPSAAALGGGSSTGTSLSDVTNANTSVPLMPLFLFWWFPYERFPVAFGGSLRNGRYLNCLQRVGVLKNEKYKFIFPRTV